MIPEDDDYFAGMDAATQVAARVRVAPAEVPWQEQAPPWLQSGGFRAYQWKRGFCHVWNFLARQRGWPMLPCQWQGGAPS